MIYLGLLGNESVVVVFYQIFQGCIISLRRLCAFVLYPYPEEDIKEEEQEESTDKTEIKR